MTTVYVLRHLPTRKNKGKERLRGQGDDPPDTDEAKEIAPQIAEILDKAGVDCLYCSPLERGVQTARMIAAEMKNKPEIEIRHGFTTWDTGRFTGELRDKVWKQVEGYIKNPEIKVPGDERFRGEPFGEFDGRQGFIPRWNKELAHQLKDAKENDGKNAWILHGNEFWTLPALMEDRQPTLKDHDTPAPGSVFKMEFADDDYKLTPLLDTEEESDRESGGHHSVS